MRKHLFISLITLALCFQSFGLAGQAYKVTGVVRDTKGQVIPFVSIATKEISQRTRTNEKGEYALNLRSGRYEMVITGVGYKKLNPIIIVQKNNLTRDFILEEDLQQLSAVKIKKKRKDRSRSIIKKLIARKKDFQKSIPAYAYKAYIKAKSDAPIKEEVSIQIGKPSEDEKKDSIKTNPYAKKQIAEVLLQVYRAYPNKIKEIREAVQIKGNKNNFFYLSSTEGDFDFYDNLIQVRALGPMSFLSPFSIGGLVSYRYKYLGSEFIDNHKYHHIRFKPSTTSNALLKGEVWIKDKEWSILKIIASFPNAHTPFYKKFKIEAVYTELKPNQWLPKYYKFDYTKHNKNIGSTLVEFKNYIIDTTFPKRFFNTELSATTKAAYKRDSSFWKKVRTAPLNQEELKTIRYKDSIYDITHSEKYRDSLEQDQNKVRLLNILWHGQDYGDWRKERYFYFSPLVSFIQPVAIGGPRFGPSMNYRKIFEDKKRLFITGNVNYGYMNKDIRGRIFGNYLFAPFSRSRVTASIQRTTSNLFWNDAIINLFDRSNYFLKETAKVGLRREFFNGFYVSNTLEIGTRKTMHDYNTVNIWDSILFNGETKKPIFFENYNAFFNELEIEYTPRQMYVREPYEKIILGSRYPTFYAKWRKGIPGVLQSIIRYDYIELGARQNLNLGTAGISTYNIKYGNFVVDGNVEPADYKFIARGNPGIFFNPLNSFQNMDSTFALFKGFGEGHYIHEFHGALLNKIPYMSKLKLAESAGGGFLIAPERNLKYVEAFVGIEKHFVLFRQPMRVGIWGVSSFANQFQNPFQLKFSIRSYDMLSNSWR